MFVKTKSVVTILSLLLIGVVSLPAYSFVPKQINYQGRLTDNTGAPVPDSTYEITFSLYDSLGTLVWSETQSAVNVVNGIFNTTLPLNQASSPFPAGLFDKDVFLGIQVGTDAEMTPRQMLTSVPFSFKAGDADTLGGLLPTDFADAAHSHTELDPTVISSVKDGVSWAEVSSKPAGFADDIDDVGISSESDPTVPAAVKDGISWAEVSSKPAGFADDIDDVGITSESDPTVLNTVKDGISWSEISNRPAGLDDGDDVGGTTGTELVIDTIDHDWILSHFLDWHNPDGGFFYIKDATSDIYRLTIDKNSGKVSIGDLHSTGNSIFDGDITVTGKVDGNMTVAGSDGWSSNGDEAIVGLGNIIGHFYIKAVFGDGLKLGAYAVGDGIVLKQITGNVGIGTSSPTSKLDVNGTTTTKVLTITGGSDIAEPFDLNADIGVKPGMVVTIDADNPGKLKVSEQPYDRSVAGIISAAGDISSGVIMSQTGTLAEGEYPVALTGRVYCWADAGNGSIIPGDLLTTSDKLGHAMKVTEYARAQGAILGKAMTPLQTGTGLVLVLVSLQ